MEVLSSEEARAVDAQAARVLGLPTALLMENAAREVANVASGMLPPGATAFVVTGKGNNGGDGWGAARHLHARGIFVRIWALAEPATLAGDARLQADVCLRLGLEQVAGLEDVRAGDVVVDALFGTGLSRPLEGTHALAVQAIAKARARGAKVLAVDLPSGLDADRHEPIGPHVVADRTLALHALKPALVQHPTRAACGTVEVAPIGLPAGESRVRWVEPTCVKGLLPPRRIDAHKGTSGHLLVVAGSEGKSGAAMLACRAAMRAGAGLVTLAASRSVLDRVLAHMPEVMGLVLPEISRERLLEALQPRDALAIGPGIEWNDETYGAIAETLRELARPAVLDADALNAIAHARDGQALLRTAQIPPVLTPHPAEMGRLLGLSTATVQADRFAAARRAVAEFKAHVVLKGACSLVAHVSGRVDVSPFENPALATAGAGDVLTGTVGALLAQGLDAQAAALAAVWAHGRAGELAAAGATRGLVASDFVEHLPCALEELL